MNAGMNVSTTRRPPGAVAIAVLLLALAISGCARVPRTSTRPGTAPPAVGVTRGDLEMLRTRGLMVPVAGVEPRRVSDTFEAGRSGGRQHNAVDIMAPLRTPVISAEAGRVLRISANTLGGLTVYTLDGEERFVYYYAHLDSYREGLYVGQPLREGDVIGYVGTTGNSPASVPHLHFQVMRYQPRRYWDGVPVNPHPFLQRTGAARP